MAEEQEEEEEEGEEVEGGSAVCRWIACSECLERRIQSDFSGDLVFRHGVSDSALPFGCAAVVEVRQLSPARHSLHFLLCFATCMGRDALFFQPSGFLALSFHLVGN